MKGESDRVQTSVKAFMNNRSNRTMGAIIEGKCQQCYAPWTVSEWFIPFSNFDS